MQRPSNETIREQCQAIADVAEPADSRRTLARKLADTGLSEDQVKRRIRAMERELGLDPARPSETGGGRRRADGSEPEHATTNYRRCGEVALRWHRRHSL